MSNKLLTDVAGILAELGVSYQQAVDISETLTQFFDSSADEDEWIDLASNATKGGECSC